MASIEQFRKLQVADIARQLAIHPFDVVRILAFSNVAHSSMQFDPADVEKVRTLGGIETWWSADCALATDGLRPRSIVRSILRELLGRGFVGNRTTRVDNVVRGMSTDDEVVARKALNLLIQERFLRSVPTAIGTFVSISPDRTAAAEAVVAGKETPAGLAVLWLS
jgi:hypothetical protein